MPARPITIRGITYPSQRKAAEAIGVHENRIHAAKSKGSLETVGLGQNPSWLGKLRKNLHTIFPWNQPRRDSRNRPIPGTEMQPQGDGS